MTHAFKFDRPVARVFPTTAPTPALRPAAAKPLSVVPNAGVAEGEVALDAGTASHMDQIIRFLDQATTRMAELLRQVKEQDEVIAGLNQRNAELQVRSDRAEEAAALHERHAGEAALKVEHLQAQAQLQIDEQERLKASVDRLISIFGGEEAALA